MADAASVISAVCSGVAVIITAAGGAYLAVRQGRSIRQAEALKEDHERSARDTGQRLIEVIDKVNTLDDRTSATARQVERIPTTSQWAFIRGQTPVPVKDSFPFSNDDEPIIGDDPTEVTPLQGPSPPPVPPLRKK